ncbi:MAG: hypothetical protein ACTIA5_09325 [Brachybacterium tyrofermentans]
MTTLGEVPSLRMIQTGPFGTQLKADEYDSTGNGVPVVSVGEIREGFIRIKPDTPRVGPEVQARLGHFMLDERDVVVSRKGAVDRSAWISKSYGPLFLGSDAIAVRFHDPDTARFYGYVLQERSIRGWLVRHAPGTTMLSMNGAVLGAVPVPASDGLRVASIVEVLGALDDKIAANRNLAESCVHLQGAYWGSLTHNAPTTPLTTVAQPHLGGTPLRSDDSAWIGHVLWASVRDLTASSGRVVFSTAERISPEASLSAPRLNVLPAGTVVLTARGTVGEVAVLGVPAAINQSAYAFVPPEGMRVALRLSIEALRDSLRQHAHGSVFSTITMSTLAEAVIPDVFDDPSHHIITRLEHLEDRRIAALRENLRLAATRDELLPLLISGRITVKDAEKTVEEVV